MKGSELAKLALKYPDFEFEFSFTDGHSTFPNIRTFKDIDLCDVGHSDKVVVITGREN